MHHLPRQTKARILCCPSEALRAFPANALMGNSEKDVCEEKWSEAELLSEGKKRP